MTRDKISLFTLGEADDMAKAPKREFDIPLNPSDCLEWKKVFFTPGVHLFGEKIAFIRQVAMFDTHTVL